MVIMRFKNVSKCYKDKKVFEELNFVLFEGQFHTVIGNGKTSLLNLMAGKESVTNGELHVFGNDPFHFEYQDRTDIFYIHDNYKLFFPKHLLETLKYYRAVFPRWSNQNFNKMLRERKFSIKKNFAQLSESQKIELLIMMALATRPKVIIIDDLWKMEKSAQDYFLPLLKKFTEFGGSVIVSSKNSEEFIEYTDQFLHLEDTRVTLLKLEKPDEEMVA